jgi:ABC-type sugar transport system permease subunit
VSFLTLRPPAEVKDNSSLGIHCEKPKLSTELKANISVFRDWKLLMLLPSFLPAGSFLIYLGSANAFHNSLRARSLLSFVAIVVQIPLGHLLHLILNNPRWNKRTRSLTGLAFVGVPLSAAWVWEVIRTSNLNRNTPPQQPMD